MPDQTTIDPQAAVDAVLGGSTPKQDLPTLEPLVQPEPVTTTPQVQAVETPKVESVPTELVSQPVVSVGDNTPLAFVGSTPVATESVNTQVVHLAASPIPEITTKPKKRKAGLIIGGILFLVIALGGGIWGYNNYATIPQVAIIKDYWDALDKAKEHEENLRGDGYQAEINANQAQYGGYAGGGVGEHSNTYVGGDAEQQGQVNSIIESAKKSGVSGAALQALLDEYGITQNSTTGNYEMANVSGTQINNLTQTAATAKAAANIAANKDGDTTNNYSASDTPGFWTDASGTLHMIQAPGVMEGIIARAQAYLDGGTKFTTTNEGKWLYDTFGITGKTNTYGDVYGIGDGSETVLVAAGSMTELEYWLKMIAAGFTWVPAGVGCYAVNDPSNNNVAHGIDGGSVDPCKTAHFTTCITGQGGINGIGCTVVKTKNEKGEEVYVSTDVTPTMSCSSISKTPAAPVLGNTVTLTCLGTVTPASAGTLSYKFRYNVNGGAYTTLTNATATTASLSIAACGTYSVQCQACATLNGVLTCDPTWTGATTN